MVNQNFFMQKALDEAWKYQGLTYPNPPVGAVIVDKDKNIIASGVHKKAGLAHAELDAVINALAYHDISIPHKDPAKAHLYIRENYKDFFKQHTIYVTLEPCNHYGKTPPCSLLLKDMGFEKVVISVLDQNKEASGGVEFLNSSCEVEVGVLKEQGEKLISFFNKWQRKKPFVFFKVAVSKNDVYTGGIISSKTSRELVHKLRESTDLLVIGGETVRTDRPTLDTRLASGKNPPDILILSRQKEFDKTIPLFSVSDRQVFISDNLNILTRYSFIMIEGGEKMFQLVKDKLDACMVFQSERTLDGKSYVFAKDFQRLKKFKYFDDTIEWKARSKS